MQLKTVAVCVAEWAGWLTIVDEKVVRSYVVASLAKSTRRGVGTPEWAMTQKTLAEAADAANRAMAAATVAKRRDALARLEKALAEVASLLEATSKLKQDEGQLVRLNPPNWHSIKQTVHHNNSECNTGNNIERENRRSGTGGKPLCAECAALSRQGW